MFLFDVLVFVCLIVLFQWLPEAAYNFSHPSR